MKRFTILTLSLFLTAASCNLFAGGGVKGVLRSEDAGKSFLASNQVSPKGNINNVVVNALTFDAKNPDTIYLGSGNGIYKSTDAGKTWVQILAGFVVSDIASDPNASDVLYAAGLAGKNGKIIKSSDGGTTWVDAYTEPSKTNLVVTLDVSKLNSQIVIAGLSTGEIIRSTDQGQSWQIITDLADVFIKLRFTNNSTAYALTASKGLVKSVDQGSNWSSVPVVGSSETFLQDANSNSTYQYWSNPNSVTFNGLTGFYDFAYDRRLPSIMFLATNQGLIRTIDSGVTWGIVYLPVKDTSLRVSAVALNPNDSNHIYTAIGSTLFQSVNGGVTWETIKLPTSQGVKNIIINPLTTNLIYLGLN